MKIAVVQLSGGLGNQIFQFAFGEYLKLNGYKVYFDKYSGFRSAKRGYRLNHLNFKITYSNKLLSYLLFILYKLKIKSLVYREIRPFFWDYNIINRNKMVTFFVGSWQNPEYSRSIKNELRDNIKLYSDYSIDNALFISKNTVAIHVRRGDYIGNEVHESIGLSYFIHSIEIMKNKLSDPTFYFFSDDITWCKENFFGDNFFFVDFTNSEIEDFLYMIKFKHFIISNSSFSWWAPYFVSERNSITICPKNWTKTRFSQNSLQLNSWIKI